MAICIGVTMSTIHIAIENIVRTAGHGNDAGPAVVRGFLLGRLHDALRCLQRQNAALRQFRALREGAGRQACDQAKDGCSDECSANYLHGV